MKLATSIMLFIVIIGTSAGLSGFHYSTQYIDTDDSDCVTVSEHDERPEACKLVCEYDPFWYKLGKRKDCYWDD